MILNQEALNDAIAARARELEEANKRLLTELDAASKLAKANEKEAKDAPLLHARVEKLVAELAGPGPEARRAGRTARRARHREGRRSCSASMSGPGTPPSPAGESACSWHWAWSRRSSSSNPTPSRVRSRGPTNRRLMRSPEAATIALEASRDPMCAVPPLSSATRSTRRVPEGRVSGPREPTDAPPRGGPLRSRVSGTRVPPARLDGRPLDRPGARCLPPALRIARQRRPGRSGRPWPCPGRARWPCSTSAAGTGSGWSTRSGPSRSRRCSSSRAPRPGSATWRHGSAAPGSSRSASTSSSTPRSSSWSASRSPTIRATSGRTPTGCPSRRSARWLGNAVKFELVSMAVGFVLRLGPLLAARAEPEAVVALDHAAGGALPVRRDAAQADLGRPALQRLRADEEPGARARHPRARPIARGSRGAGSSRWTRAGTRRPSTPTSRACSAPSGSCSGTRWSTSWARRSCSS